MEYSRVLDGGDLVFDHGGKEQVMNLDKLESWERVAREGGA